MFWTAENNIFSKFGVKNIRVKIGFGKQFPKPFSLFSATQILRADDCFRQPSALSFLINHKLGIFAVFLIRADEKKIHITGNSEAPVSAKLTFKLICKVGGVIIK